MTPLPPPGSDSAIYVSSSDAARAEDGEDADGGAVSDGLAFSDEDLQNGYGGDDGDGSSGCGASSIDDDDDDYGAGMAEPVISTRQVQKTGARGNRGGGGARRRGQRKRKNKGGAGGRPPFGTRSRAHPLSTRRRPRQARPASGPVAGLGVRGWGRGLCERACALPPRGTSKTNASPPSSDRRSPRPARPRTLSRTFSLTSPSPSSQAKPYTILDEKALQARQAEAVEAVCAVLSIPPGEAVRVLREFKWCVVRVGWREREGGGGSGAWGKSSGQVHQVGRG